MVPTWFQTSIWKQFRPTLLPSWLRRTLSDSAGCSRLSIIVFHPYTQHQSSFGITLKMIFLLQIPFQIFLGSSFDCLFVFLQMILCKWPDQLGPAITASLPDVLPEVFNRQMKFLCFSSFYSINKWRICSWSDGSYGKTLSEELLQLHLVREKCL